MKPFVFEVRAARPRNQGAGESSSQFHDTVRSTLKGAGRYFPLSPRSGRIIVEDELDHTHRFIEQALESQRDLISVCGISTIVEPEQAPYVSGNHPNVFTLRPREGETLYAHAVRAIVNQYPEAEFVPEGPTGGGTVTIYRGNRLLRYTEVRNAIRALGVLENASYGTPVVLPNAPMEPAAASTDETASAETTPEQAPSS